ncbi:MAG: SDR family NAD(P)-dependent oxidoreductase [Xanthobacteraceae bacterium]
MDLQGKIVLVTGASSGIGKAIAVAFARKRSHVLVHYGRNKAGAQETLSEVEKFSSGRIHQADLMDAGAVESLFDEIRRTTATVDILVNNAGESRPGDLGEHSIWDYEYKNILLSAIRASDQFISMPCAHLRKIINITSIYGNLPTGDPDYLQYSAFKAALANVTATLCKSAAPQILVNAVAPGYTDTPAWAGASSESKHACARATLNGRFVRPEEVAHAVIFIAENDALAGQVLTLDGGTSLKGIA